MSIEEKARTPVSATGMGHRKDPIYERWRWQVFGITWLAYVGFYLTRKAFSAAKAGMLEDPHLSITKAQMGLIDGAYLIAYAIGQFAWGIAGDRYGTRRVLLIGMLASVIVGAGMGVSSIVLILGVVFFIQGLCQSSGWGPLTKNVGCWFSRKERGRTYGWWCTNYAIGGLIATPFAAYTAEWFGWRSAFFATAGALLLIWLLFLRYQRNRPEDCGLPEIEAYHCEPGEALLTHVPDDGSRQGTDPPTTPVVGGRVGVEDEEHGSWNTIVATLKNMMVLRLGLVYFCLKPARYAILFWGPLIVYEKLGTGVGQSGLIAILFEAAGPLGAIAAGYASDKLFGARRMPVCVIGLFILSLVAASFELLTRGGSVWAMCGILFAIGFFLFGPDSTIAATAAVDFGTKRGASTSVGIINGFGSIGGVIGGSLPGVISEKCGWGALFYGLAGLIFVAALLLIPKWNAVPSSKGS